MESAHKRELSRRFQSCLRDARIIVLGIADDEFLQPELVTLLKRTVAPHLP